MSYFLMTGGTGLLGEYVVRNLLLGGHKLALVVRPSRRRSAEERIHDLIAGWHARAGEVLPLPVVLEGELTEAGLGLSDAARQWVRENCGAVIHNAASLTFQAASADDEPWRSNLEGTRQVLALCEAAGIKKFHHVSTAYVCGLRDGVVMEADLDVGQVHGNDYEVSKFRAEKMVRGAPFLESVTVHRPGIIVGDARDGYTSTFHGFYVPLKLLSSLLSRASGFASTREELRTSTQLGGQRLTEILNLTGHECKNFVPVNWVADVMARVIATPALHGKTYHLTPSAPVPLKTMREALEAAFQQYSELSATQKYDETRWQDLESYFREGMDTYKSYWRNDPVFDTTNTRAAAGADLPCPAMDHAFFMRLCAFAIESGFGKRNKRRAAAEVVGVAAVTARTDVGAHS